MPLHLQRQREIVEILTRNGFDLLVSASGIRSKRARSRIAHALTPHSWDEVLNSPEIVRRTLEELGPTFIKLGQILSTRPDLIPVPYCRELTKLQSQAPIVRSEEIHRTIEAELGAPVSELFASFEDIPLGSASIGQTHCAMSKDGQKLVVKVQRANILPKINADLQIMKNIVRTLSRRWPTLRHYDAIDFVNDFERQLHAEMNYLTECKNAETIGANLAGEPGVHVPAMYRELSTSKVLTMERLEGIRVDDVAALDAAGIDRKELGRRAATLVLKMVLEDGFFHADPHAGNLLVEADGTLGLMDFGMVGSITDQVRDRLVAMVVAFAGRDIERLTDGLLKLAPPRGSVDRDNLAAALDRMMSPFMELPLNEIPATDVLVQLFTIVRTHRLRPPPSVALIGKMLIMVDGLGRTLDPDFEILTVITPFAVHVLQEKLSPLFLLNRLLGSGVAAVNFGLDLPDKVKRLLDDYEQGGVHVKVDASELEPYMDRIEVLGDRLLAGLLVSALIRALGDLGATNDHWLSKARGPLMIFGAIATIALSGYLTTTSFGRD